MPGKGFVPGYGYVSKDADDLFRTLKSEFANQDADMLKAPFKVMKAPKEKLQDHYPVGVLRVRVRLKGEENPIVEIVTGQYMRWAVVQALSLAFKMISTVMVKPQSILFLMDTIEVEDVKVPIYADQIWQFCTFRFEYAVQVKEEALGTKLVSDYWRNMTKFETEFCMELENKCRELYIISVLSLPSKKYILINGSSVSAHRSLFEAAQRNDVNSITNLLSSGADVNAHPKLDGMPKALFEEDVWWVYVNFGRTALLGAAEEGHMEAMQVLLKHGAAVNFQDTAGFHALYLAAGACQQNSEPLDFLLKSGANLELKNARGLTALHNACGSGAVEGIKFLLDARADINVKSESGLGPIHVAVLSEQISSLDTLFKLGVNMDMPALGGNTCVHEAVLMNKASIVQKLFDFNADINVESGPSTGYQTPLKMARERKKKKVVTLLTKLEAIEELDYERPHAVATPITKLLLEPGLVFTDAPNVGVDQQLPNTLSDAPGKKEQSD